MFHLRHHSFDARQGTSQFSQVWLFGKHIYIYIYYIVLKHIAIWEAICLSWSFKIPTT